MTLAPWLRRSGMAPCPWKRRIKRPAPPSPGRKALLHTATVLGETLAGAALVVAATLGVAVCAPGDPALAALAAANEPIASPKEQTRCKARRRDGRRL